MKAIWEFINRDSMEVVGKLVIEGRWSDEGFRDALTDLIEHYSQNPYLIPDFFYDSSAETITEESK